MRLTVERLLALVVTVVNGVLGAVWGRFLPDTAAEAGLAVLLSVPGLVVIWFRESLRDPELAFPRGIRNASPPWLLAIIGWFLLLVIPMFFVFKLSGYF